MNLEAWVKGWADEAEARDFGVSLYGAPQRVLGVLYREARQSVLGGTEQVSDLILGLYGALQRVLGTL